MKSAATFLSYLVRPNPETVPGSRDFMILNPEKPGCAKIGKNEGPRSARSQSLGRPSHVTQM